MTEEIDRPAFPFDPNNALDRLDAICGVNRQMAEVLLAELATDMRAAFSGLRNGLLGDRPAQ